MKQYKHPYWTSYSASENGSVYGSRGGELSPIKHHTGYLVITVRKDGRQKQLRTHRFIWECCVGEIPKGMVINHIDGNKHNNKLSNLEVVTHKQNVDHAWQVLEREVVVKGEDNGCAKLTEEQAEDIIMLCKKGWSNPDIAKRYNLHPNYISLIRHNKRWKHLPR